MNWYCIIYVKLNSILFIIRYFMKSRNKIGIRTWIQTIQDLRIGMEYDTWWYLNIELSNSRPQFLIATRYFGRPSGHYELSLNCLINLTCVFNFGSPYLLPYTTDRFRRKGNKKFIKDSGTILQNLDIKILIKHYFMKMLSVYYNYKFGIVQPLIQIL